jgi:hypothetical protein
LRAKKLQPNQHPPSAARVDRLINHVTGTISGVAAIYNRNKYFPEMCEAVQLWEAKLDSIVGR